jgi:isoquinoline 1-oxidoreductase alpha subunit
MTTTFTLNGRAVDAASDPDTPLLWVLREEFGLTGAKYGCGAQLCGACMIHLDGRAQPSCMLPLALVEGRAVTTIEGLSADGAAHPVQQAWTELDVPQCGYCQCGQMMAAAALIAETPRPSREEIRAGMRRNLCRCGAYQRIEAAVARAAEIAA